ncbi:myb-like dna-binding domain containing protein [Stylonychia lemnae]|uniref:Myb-like dna-binding domain containing protein n=1 Tax=Stylonychia lemnae TaxID=5949 RepID=A0A078AJ69_STYLE|nr:myb-like dna-binding domain containing protein [Stylonychia lemnae]|eukprot:CDW80848.1 myb-like dna-binding domain containing protein [Stylonychia lemnae]
MTSKRFPKNSDDQASYQTTQADAYDLEGKHITFDSSGSNSLNTMPNHQFENNPYNNNNRNIKTHIQQQPSNGFVSGILNIFCGCCNQSSVQITPETIGFQNSGLILKKNRDRGSNKKIGKNTFRLDPSFDTYDDDSDINKQVSNSSKINFEEDSTDILQKVIEGLDEIGQSFLNNQLSLFNYHSMIEWQSRILSDLSSLKQQKQKSQQQTKRKRDPKSWSILEDEFIEKAYKQYGSNWAKISCELDSGKDAQACRKRISYLECIGGSKLCHKGATEFETNQKILDLVKVHGKYWKIIQKQIPNLTTKQIRDRYNNIKNTIKQVQKFTNADDKKLIERHELYSKRKDINVWKEIAKGFNGKNAAALKERYFELQGQTSFNTKETSDISSIPKSIDGRLSTTKQNPSQSIQLDQDPDQSKDSKQQVIIHSNTDCFKTFPANGYQGQFKFIQVPQLKSPQNIQMRLKLTPADNFNYDTNLNNSCIQSQEDYQYENEYQANRKKYPAVSLGSDQYRNFGHAGNVSDQYMKQTSIYGSSSGSHSFVKNINDKDSVFRRGSLFSQGPISKQSRFSEHSIMNRQGSNSIYGGSMVRGMTVLPEEDVQSISTHLSRMSLAQKSNVTMENEADI